MTRRGMMLLEVIVAGALLLAMMAICLQMLHAAAGQHRATEIRQTAIREAANVMERLAAVPWHDLTAEGTGQIKLSADANRHLPGGKLDVELVESADHPEAKRIIVRVHWKDRAGQPVRPVQLVAWRYPARSDPIHRVEP